MTSRFARRAGGLAALGSLLAMLPACHSNWVDGRLVDNFGRPVAQVRVAFEGTTIQAWTDVDGRFEIPNRVGLQTLQVSGGNALPAQRWVRVPPRQKVSLGTWRVLRRPTGTGFVIQGRGAYVPVPAQPLGHAQREGATGACATWTAPPDPPEVRADHFLALIAVQPHQHVVIWRVGDGGALATDHLHASGCPESTWLLATDQSLERAMAGEYLVFRGELSPASYCAVRYDDAFRLEPDGFCFRWSN